MASKYCACHCKSKSVAAVSAADTHNLEKIHLYTTCEATQVGDNLVILLTPFLYLPPTTIKGYLYNAVILSIFN